jgi:hypothetical protein
LLGVISFGEEYTKSFTIVPPDILTISSQKSLLTSFGSCEHAFRAPDGPAYTVAAPAFLVSIMDCATALSSIPSENLRAKGIESA